MSKVQVVVGGQFGSEAKGHVAGFLAAEESDTLAIRVAGPNAGHSVVHPQTGVKYALRQIPVAAVTNPDATLMIAPGSEIDIEVLTREIMALEQDGIKIRERLIIDSAATIITLADITNESSAELTRKIGSTGKGIGSARAARAMRTAATAKTHKVLLSQWSVVENTRAVIRGFQGDGRRSLVQVEGTQGYGLGLHTHFYPQVTSSDCTAIDFLAMAGVSPWYGGELEIWVVFRPYPIRVAGNSGPMHKETSWDRLGLEPEYTTVTKKMRRVGQWDPALASAAISANGGPGGAVKIALTMADQLDPTIAGTTDPETLLRSGPVREFLNRVEPNLPQRFELITTSDRTCVDLR